MPNYEIADNLHLYKAHVNWRIDESVKRKEKEEGKEARRDEIDDLCSARIVI